SRWPTPSLGPSSPSSRTPATRRSSRTPTPGSPRSTASCAASAAHLVHEAVAVDRDAGEVAGRDEAAVVVDRHLEDEPPTFDGVEHRFRGDARAFGDRREVCEL